MIFTEQISFSFQDTEHFLINPFGTLYSEVTASSLIKVDMQGNVVEAGTTNYGVNVAGFMMHSAVHANRPDLKCVLHLRHPPVTAVSSLLLISISGMATCSRVLFSVSLAGGWADSATAVYVAHTTSCLPVEVSLRI